MRPLDDMYDLSRSPPPHFHSPDWDLLISGQLATHERASLIATIFLECDEIEVVRRLSARFCNYGMAQAFVDVIDEGSLRALCLLKNGLINSD